MTKIIALIIFATGILLIGNVAFPIVHYEITKQTNLDEQIISPLSEGANEKVLGESYDWSRAIKTSNLIRPSNWFEGTEVVAQEEINSAVKYYTLSIPKLKINKATVEVAGVDLSKNLVHYPGTASPGQTGNVVVFGHSVLPQFFNPKNYLTIFSTLPTIKKGDEVEINYDGISYRYLVTELFEVPPSAVEVLRQYHDGRHLTLITCVPPGTYLRRLVVRADLIPPEI